MTVFRYLNHRGELTERHIRVDALEFLFRPGYGYQPGWFLSGHDLDKDARRSFSLNRVHFEIPTHARETFVLWRPTND